MTKLPVYLLLLVAAAGSSDCLSAQTTAASLRRQVDSLVGIPLGRNQVAGLSLAVIRGNDTLIFKGYGKADADLVSVNTLLERQNP